MWRSIKIQNFLWQNVVYGLWAKTNEKNCTARPPFSLPRPAPYQVGSYFKAFPSYKTATWETQLDGKKEEHSWTALEANCFTWTRRQSRKRALFGVICPTWRRILGKTEESSWVMFKAHLRDLARSWGGINFAWAGWHDEAFRCCVIFAFLWNSTLGSKPLFVRGHVGFWHGSYSWDLYWQQHVGAAFVHLSDWVGLGLCWSVDGK